MRKIVVQSLMLDNKMYLFVNQIDNIFQSSYYVTAKNILTDCISRYEKIN